MAGAVGSVRDRLVERGAGLREIDEVAAVLLRYMQERRGAGDTLRGITRWWWERQAFEDAYRRVELALEQLVAAGELVKRPLVGGDDLFYVPGPTADSALTAATGSAAGVDAARYDSENTDSADDPSTEDPPE